jgi:uncharacterized Ntn-hydrolase superfamily protein
MIRTDRSTRRAASVVALVALLSVQPARADAPFGTFSIVARDPATGELGVAVQSRAFNVGMAVPWAEAGVGAIATQAATNESFGPNGLELMRRGLDARQTLERLLAADAAPASRQLAMIDAAGTTAQHTGERNGTWAGGRMGDNYACQGNLLAGEAVVEAMAEAFEATPGELSERLLAALVAAQGAGGDRRGKQSAALLVVRPSDSRPEYRHRYVDLRVDDDPEPIEEIVRLYRILEGTDLAQAHVRYAEEYLRTGDDAAAELEMSRLAIILDGALERPGTSAGTLNGLAWSLATHDVALERALPAAEKAVALEPENSGIVDTLAEVLFRLERWDEAVAAGRRALELSPDDPYLTAQLKRFENRWSDVAPGEAPPEAASGAEN